MKASEAVEVLGHVRDVWRLSAVADPRAEAELWVKRLAVPELTLEDAITAVDRFDSTGFAPTILQVKAGALAEARFRLQRLELPAPDGVDLAEWKASEEGQAALEAARAEGAKSARQLELEQELEEGLA